MKSINLFSLFVLLGLLSLTGCLPVQDQSFNEQAQPNLVERPIIQIVSTNSATADLLKAYAIVGDSIRFTLNAKSGNGLNALRITQTTNLESAPTTLKRETIANSNDLTTTYTYQIRPTTSNWIRLGFFVMDAKNQESFIYFKIFIMKVTTGTAIKEVILYRQGLPATVATAGSVYAQFLSTRKQMVASKFRNDLAIDLCYGVDAAGDPYLFSPDLSQADIASSFALFPASQISNPFAGGIRFTNDPVAKFTKDSLRQEWTPTASEKKIKIEKNKVYVVRCYPLDPLTPPYRAVVNVTSIVDSIRFSQDNVVKAKSLQMKANVSIIQ
jgi:hypothetical protein